VIYI